MNRALTIRLAEGPGVIPFISTWIENYREVTWDETSNAISPEACAEEYEKQKRTIKKYFFFLILQTNDFISLITDC